MAGITYHPTQAQRPRRLWTADEYDRLVEIGVFTPDERLELLEGEITPKMTQNPPHVLALHKAARALERVFGSRGYVRLQVSLALGERNRPEPDVAVVAGRMEDYATQHPSQALLVVEISDTTLDDDRNIKAQIYARANIAEYWIVNLVARLLEVHRVPAPMADAPLGFGYRSIQRYTETQTIAPLAAPESSINVADLLP